MYRQTLGAVLGCFCATAMAGHGFEPIAAIAPDAAGGRAVAVGDVTGDGRDDVVVLAGGTQFFYRNRVLLYAQTPGGFAPAVAIDYHAEPTSYDASGTGIALADLDADHDLDIVVSHGSYASASLVVLRNDGAGFTAASLPTMEPMRTMKFTDVDGDGHLDLVGQTVYGDIAIFPGDGSAGFGAPAWLQAGGYPYAFQLADFDGDSVQDLVYQSWDVIYVRVNEGGGFAATPRALLNAGYSAKFLAEDLNGDQRADLVVSPGYWGERSLVLYPQGNDGRYRRKILLPGGHGYVADLRASDLDADGRLDLVVQNDSYDGRLGVRLARASGGFAPAVTHETGETSSYVLGDVDDDGLPDAVVLGGNGGVSYMLGRTSARGADPAVFLGLNAGAAALRVENRGDVGTGAYELTLSLDPRMGAVNAGAIPSDCYAYTTWTGDLRVTCQMPALAAGAHHERVFPFGITAQRTPLVGTARLNHGWPELRMDNNVARKMIHVTRPPN